MIVDIIGALLIGLVVGYLARFLLPGKDPMGCLMTSVLGIAGSFVGGFIGRALFTSNHPYFRPGFLMSLLGAILVLLIVRMMRR